MDDSRCQESKDTSLPVEVWENILDMLYSFFLRDQVEHTRALHSCALVCRAWRIRSQRNLFYSVLLRGAEYIRRFAAVLDSGTHLSDYVREVILFGHDLHTTANLLSLFPVLLRGKLQRLQQLSIKHITDEATWYPTTSELQSTKRLEHVSLHPRFPLFFSVFTTVTCLSIYDVTFRHFNDFLGTVNALPALQILDCEGVQFKTLGPLPTYMKQWTDMGRSATPPFAPNLQELELVCPLQCTRNINITLFSQSKVDMRCMQALVSACAPRLRELVITMPFTLVTRMVISSE